MTVAPRLDRPLERHRPWEKARLLAEVIVLFARVRMRMRTQKDVERILTDLRGDLREDGTAPLAREEIYYGRRMGSVVAQVLGRLPGDTRCLARSLVLSGLLARRGLRSTLVIGVRSAPTFGAHAWVERAGNPLLEPIESGGHRLTEL